MKKDPDPKVVAFLAEIDPYVERPYGVQLKADLDDYAIGFDRDTPDRLYCGRVVFEEMRARGVLVKEPN